MRIAMGGDAAGYELKTGLARRLTAAGHEVHDVGVAAGGEVDFPDVAAQLCALIISGESERGILVCGTGIGASIAANKIPGIRAALAHDVFSAHQCVEHDDCNVLCVGAWIVGSELAAELAATFLAARWISSVDHVRRVEKLTRLEDR